jgi:ribosome-binding factor A
LKPDFKQKEVRLQTVMNNRIPRVQELMKEELGKILLREVDMPEGALLTITRVEASGNLQQAKVYISVMPDDQSKEVLRVLRQSIYDIQQELNERLEMRPVPKIRWIVDGTAAEVQRVKELLDKIKKEA